MNYVKFAKEKLSVENITELVRSSRCGAISLFIGTTRDNFEGKEVLNLEYEAYESMGLKKMEEICEEIRRKWVNVENIAIYHRLGTVPVAEASIVIAISSPHRSDAIKATEFCIDTIKKSVPIWKKEIYSDKKAEWKENDESQQPDCKKAKFDFQQEVELPFVAPNLIQIKANNKEIFDRIENFMSRKRDEININNIAEFCKTKDFDHSCARVDSTIEKRKDSKGHLQVNRVLNTYHRDQTSSEYLTKYIPPNGVEERLLNLETQLNLATPVPRNIYRRLKILEDRLLYLESISPEYIQFWDRASVSSKSVKKKIFNIDEIDLFIADLKKCIS